MDIVCEGFDLERERHAAFAGTYVYTEYAPGDTKRELLAFIVHLTNDATVANRQIQIQLYDGALGEVLSETIIGQAIAASATGSLYIGAINALNGATIAQDYCSILPGKWFTNPDIGIRVTIINGQAGDDYDTESYYKQTPL